MRRIRLFPGPFPSGLPDKSEAKPVKLDGGTRIVCREKDAGFQRQAVCCGSFYQAEQDCPWRGWGERGPSG